MSVLVEYEEDAVIEALRKLKLSPRPDLITTSPAVNEGENFMSDAIRVDVRAHNEDTGQ